MSSTCRGPPTDAINPSRARCSIRDRTLLLLALTFIIRLPNSEIEAALEERKIRHRETALVCLAMRDQISQMSAESLRQRVDRRRAVNGRAVGPLHLQATVPDMGRDVDQMWPCIACILRCADILGGKAEWPGRTTTDEL